MADVLNVRDISKIYSSSDSSVQVLDSVSFTLQEGDTCAVVGPSGSGKTTLLSLCAGLDTPSMGSVQLQGKDLGQMTEDQRAEMRNRDLGFVFQSFHLMPSMTALENVMLPAELAGFNGSRQKAKTLLEDVGLGDRVQHYPAQLSGGEQQRVAIARAFVNQPKVLFADEPTGNLDYETGAHVEDLLFQINRDHGTTLLLITHDERLAQKTKRLLKLERGRLVD